jgi:hypothetical protein
MQTIEETLFANRKTKEKNAPNKELYLIPPRSNQIPL